MFRHLRNQIKDCIGEFLSEFDRRESERTKVAKSLK